MLTSPHSLTAVLVALVFVTPAPAAELLLGFHRSAWFDEQVREEWVADGVRALANAPAAFDPKRPTRTSAGSSKSSTPAPNAARRSRAARPEASLTARRRLAIFFSLLRAIPHCLRVSLC